MDASPSIFESFNARTLRPAQVARTFVPPPQYERLAKRNHSQLIGPRGSGKTTLLKMLTPAGLEAWPHPLADHYRSQIDFTGIFIAADNSWKTQLESIAGDKSLSDPHARVLATAAFSTHVLLAFTKTVQYRVRATESAVHPFRRCSWSKAQEADFVGLLSASWKLPVRVASFEGLRSALASRLTDIGVVVSKERVLGDVGRAERLASQDFLHIQFVDAVVLAVEIFQNIGRQAEESWALLFDELELVPSWIRAQLLQAMRSVDQRLIFKLSMSPFSEDAHLLGRSSAPAEDEDYDQITLSYAHKDQGLRFCDALFRSMATARGRPDLTPVELLGKSRQESSRAEWSHLWSAYTPGSPLQVQFARLATTDRSFRKYVDQRGLELQQLHKLSEDERAADIRKVSPIVAVRDAYRNVEVLTRMGAKRRTRSRKNPKIYSGAASLFAISEGNPRWFIGLVGPLLDEWVRLTQSRRPIDPAKQTRQVERACARFLNLLRTIPCEVVTGRTPKGVVTVIDSIGKYIHHETVLGPFDPDAPGTFIIDVDTPRELLSSLGQALNAGAIVFVPDGSPAPAVDTLRGARFRLCYLLCPHYKIPLRLGRAVHLSGILKSEPESPPLFQ